MTDAKAGRVKKAVDYYLGRLVEYDKDPFMSTTYLDLLFEGIEAELNCSDEVYASKLHAKNMEELAVHCAAIEELVEGYFRPPTLMACGGKKWDVFIRRKGSDTEFGPSEWKGE